MIRSEIRYARTTDGLDIAYQVLGDGPLDFVFVPAFITHLDWSWEFPAFTWLERLDGVARVITFDKRGTGLSDRSLGFGSLEDRSRDIAAVMDAVGSEKAFLSGMSEGGPLAILFAAANPDRVQGLVLYASMLSGPLAPGSSHPVSREFYESAIEAVEADWGTGTVYRWFVQHAPDTEAVTRLIARLERNACTPTMAADIMRHNGEIDVRPLLSAIAVPTLVVHARGDPVVPFADGAEIVDRIDGAELVALDGDFHGSWRPSDVARWRDAAIEFLGRAGAPLRPVDRVLAAVLFTDIVDSTVQAAELGDADWHSLLDRHDRIVAGEVEHFGGRLVKSTGDGALVVLDGPSAGIDAARAVRDALRPHGVCIRAGLHVGEVEVRGDDVAGLGVVIASRICDQAAGGQILVTRTVKDLITGSNTELTDAGERDLKGFDETWHLYELV